VALLFFLAATVDLAWEGVSTVSLQRAFPLYALGGFSILIFGTSRLLIAGMAGRDIAGGSASSASVVILAAVGSIGAFFAPPDFPEWRLVFALAWSLAAVGHTLVTVLTVRRPPVRPPIQSEAGPAQRFTIRILEAVSLLYALAAAVMLPLAAVGSISLASSVHVVLVGFVVVTIMSVASHILPRFTRAQPSAWAMVPLGPLALVGPGLMAAGLDRWRGLLPLGALLEGLAFLIFGIAVVHMLVRANRVRLTLLPYALAPVLIGIGGSLALVFALWSQAGDQLATHGFLNTFGFVGLMVLGASTDLYAPAMTTGSASARRHLAVVLTLALSGLLIGGLALATHHETAARAGVAVFALGIAWQLVGVIASHKRADRVVSRLTRKR